MIDEAPLTPPPGRRIYLRHVKASGFCIVPGAKNWFELHGFNWKDVVRNGVPIEDIMAIDDALAKRVVATALREYGNERGEGV